MELECNSESVLLTPPQPPPPFSISVGRPPFGDVSSCPVPRAGTGSPQRGVQVTGRAVTKRSGPRPCPAAGAGAFISTQPSVLVSLSVNELYVDDPDKDSGGKIDVSLNISLPNLHCECEYPQQPPAPAGRTGQTANTRDRRLSPLLWRGECDRMHMHLAAFWNKKHKKPPTGVTSGGRPCRGGEGVSLRSGS